MDHNTGNYAKSASLAPLARAEELVVEEIGDERLVYDLRVNRAHSLSGTATQVWQRCDGKTTIATIAAQLELDADTVARALDELESCDLLDTGGGLGTTRRELGVRIAKVGGAVAAAPLILSLTAPPALALLTPTVEFCTNGGASHGCGIDCNARSCCCCCQSIPAANVPSLCDSGMATMCCLPIAQCGPIFKGNCTGGGSCP